MSGTLVVAEWIDGQLAATAPNLISAAARLGGPVTLGVVTAEVDQVAGQAGFAGVGEILAVRADTADFDAEHFAAAVGAMIQALKPSLVLMAYSIRSASFAAALAEALDLGFASDVVTLERVGGELLATRPVYGGKVHAEVAFSSEVPALALLRADLWPAASPAPASAVRELELPARAPSRVRHRDYRRPEAGVDLRRADVIFAVGRGVGEQANIEPFAAIAKRLDVALGASRPLIDAGWLPAPHQVGQTGVIVKPRLYVAFGISGALQHLVGMQGSSTVVAVNSDPEAAIFDFADVGAVADINEVAKELQALLA